MGAQARALPRRAGPGGVGTTSHMQTPAVVKEEKKHPQTALSVADTHPHKTCKHTQHTPLLSGRQRGFQSFAWRRPQGQSCQGGTVPAQPKQRSMPTSKGGVSRMPTNEGGDCMGWWHALALEATIIVGGGAGNNRNNSSNNSNSSNSSSNTNSSNRSLRPTFNSVGNANLSIKYERAVMPADSFSTSTCC